MLPAPDPKKRIHDLTIEEVRACPLFAHLTDQELRDVIESLTYFTRIIYHAYLKESGTSSSHS